MSEDNVVEVHNLSRRFGKTTALDGVSAEVRPGSVYGLVGANGQGKTTLIKHLLGLLKAKQGTVRVFGMDPIQHPVEVLQQVGYLSEERDLLEWMRIDELLRYTSAFHPDWEDAYAQELLDTFGLDKTKKVKQLSKGMRAQAGLITAVAHRPQLVLIPMSFIIGTAVICFLLPAWLFNYLMETSLPAVRLVPAIACLVTCLVASAWSPTTVSGKLFSITLVALGAVISVYVFHSQHNAPDPFMLAMGKPDYFSFSWYHYVAFLMISATAVVLAVIGVDLQRHGEAWQVPLSLRTSWGHNRRTVAETRLPAPKKVTGKPTKLAQFFRVGISFGVDPFCTRLAAQCWYEFRRAGPTMFWLCTFTPLLPLVLLSIADWMESGWHGTPSVWLGFLFLCPFVYQLVAAETVLGLRHSQGAAELSAFDRTRSLRNDELVAIKLLVVATCSFAGWLWMCMTAIAYATVIGHWESWAHLSRPISAALGDVPVGWWLVGLSNAVLFYISSSSTLFAFGLWLPRYSRRLYFGAVVLFAHALLALWDAQNGWTFRGLWATYGYCVAIGIAVTCLLSLQRALVSGFLGKRLFATTFCFWAIYVGSSIAGGLKLTDSYPLLTAPVIVTLCGCLLLVPLATTAVAPLALASHRHA